MKTIQMLKALLQHEKVNWSQVFSLNHLNYFTVCPCEKLKCFQTVFRYSQKSMASMSQSEYFQLPMSHGALLDPGADWNTVFYHEKKKAEQKKKKKNTLQTGHCSLGKSMYSLSAFKC